MNMCANHPEKAAVAYCRMCGKPLCSVCRIERLGAIYCAEDAPPLLETPAGVAAPSPYVEPVLHSMPDPVASPYTAPVGQGSPFLALILGFIPGVGAIYNGQYAKGLIHAVIFGLLVSVANSGHTVFEPLIGILIAAWSFYMVFEAYHTARRRRLGLPLDELSSVVNLHSSRSGLPVGAVVLIGAGLLLLMDSTGVIPVSILVRYWPVALILLGVYMLYTRLHRTEIEPEPVPPREFLDERR
jgi:hypothetical protein